MNNEIVDPVARIPALVEAMVTSLVKRITEPRETPESDAQRRLTTFLLAQNRRLADAFGACVCWGRDASCRTCGGFGGPGFCEPKRDALRRMVLEVCRHDVATGTYLLAALQKEMIDE